MKEIKEIFHNKKIYIFAVITMMFFGIFCKVQYAPDTYSVFTNSVSVSVAHFFSCGRYITGLATGFLMGILHLSNTKIYYVSYLFAILFMVISIYKLDKLIEKRVKNKFVSAIIAVITTVTTTRARAMRKCLEDRRGRGACRSCCRAARAWKGMLARNIGRAVIVSFLVGSQNTVVAVGTLQEVGNDYITLFHPGRSAYITADIYSIRFVEFPQGDNVITLN